jgi:uncharacterized membrane protein
LPPPEQLEHYDRVHPGLAERIVKMTEQAYALAEHQTNHRITLERRVINNNIVLSYLGWFSGFSLGSGGLIAAIFLALRGKELTGAAAFLGAVGTLAGLFFYGRKKEAADLRGKRPE